MAIIRPGEISLPIPPSFLSPAAAINSMEQQSHRFLSGASAAAVAAATTEASPNPSASATDISATATGVPSVASEASIASAVSAGTLALNRF